MQTEACPCMSSLLRLVRLAPALLPNQPDHATMVISHVIIILRVSGKRKRIFYRHVWPDQRPPCVRGGHPALRQLIACLHMCTELSYADMQLIEQTQQAGMRPGGSLQKPAPKAGPAPNRPASVTHGSACRSPSLHTHVHS